MKLFERAFDLAHCIFPTGGTCLEFGVYTGGTYLWQARQILKRHPGSNLVGFDSWAGLPPETPGVWNPPQHDPGGFTASKEDVIAKLRALTGGREDPRFRLVDGFFSESLTDETRDTIDNLIFVNIDVDIHRSTIELLDFVKPLLRPGVILYWDDWKDPAWRYREEPWGEHLAWAQWSAYNPDVVAETIEINPMNQRMMVVLEANGIKAEDAGIAIYQVRWTACSRIT